MELNEAMAVLVAHGKKLVEQMHCYYMTNEDAYLSDAVESAMLDGIDKAAVLLAINEVDTAFDRVQEEVDYCVYTNETVRG